MLGLSEAAANDGPLPRGNLQEATGRCGGARKTGGRRSHVGPESALTTFQPYPAPTYCYPDSTRQLTRMPSRPCRPDRTQPEGRGSPEHGYQGMRGHPQQTKPDLLANQPPTHTHRQPPLPTHAPQPIAKSTNAPTQQPATRSAKAPNAPPAHHNRQEVSENAKREAKKKKRGARGRGGGGVGPTHVPGESRSRRPRISTRQLPAILKIETAEARRGPKHNGAAL